MQVEWRGVTGEADLDAWVEALDAVEAVDCTGELVGRDDLVAQLGLSYFDGGADARLAWSAGRVVAWGTALCVPNDRHWRVMLDGAVVPDHRGRGLGTALLEWLVARGAVVAARRAPGVPSWLELGASEGDRPREELFAAFGFAPTRWFPLMRRRLEDRTRPAAVPAGVAVVGFDPDRDEATRAAHNEAFADHFAAMPLDEESWATWVTGDPHFRADLSFLALAGDDVVGYALNSVYPDEWAALGFSEGWTHQLGVRRPWRGRGVAGALLDATADAFAAAGLDVATLQVDADSPTGAHALYRRHGYEPGTTRVTWTRPAD